MRALSITVLFFCAFVLSSCSLSPMKTPPESTYTLTDTAQLTDASHSARSNKTILITTPVASSGYQSSRMIYQTVPYQMKSFGDHRWVAPPSDLLLPLIANRIRATHYFHAVVTSPFSGSANFQLNTQLLILQQEFLQPQSVVRLVVQATLINMANGHVVASRVFKVVVPADQNNPYAGVVAANQAVQLVLSHMTRFVLKHV
jgi:cholesterol transport system auxiliary component